MSPLLAAPSQPTRSAQQSITSIPLPAAARLPLLLAAQSITWSLLAAVVAAVARAAAAARADSWRAQPPLRVEAPLIRLLLALAARAGRPTTPVRRAGAPPAIPRHLMCLPPPPAAEAVPPTVLRCLLRMETRAVPAVAALGAPLVSRRLEVQPHPDRAMPAGLAWLGVALMWEVAVAVPGRWVWPGTSKIQVPLVEPVNRVPSRALRQPMPLAAAAGLSIPRAARVDSAASPDMAAMAAAVRPLVRPTRAAAAVARAATKLAPVPAGPAS